MIMMRLKWLLVIVVMVTVMEQGVESKVDYDCIFGPMYSVEEGGQMHHFCALNDMSPPFMNRGEYQIAQHISGTCYECVCEDDIHKACCEIDQCPQL